MKLSFVFVCIRVSQLSELFCCEEGVAWGCRARAGKRASSFPPRWSAPFFHPGDRSSAGCAPLNSLARRSRAAPPVFARFPCGGSITEVTRDIDVAPRRSTALSVSTYSCRASRVCCCWHVLSGQNLKINKHKIDVWCCFWHIYGVWFCDACRDIYLKLTDNTATGWK